MERVSDAYLDFLLAECARMSVSRLPSANLAQMITELKEHRDLERANDALQAMSLHAMGDE